jgi:hypothetical protein
MAMPAANFVVEELDRSQLTAASYNLRKITDQATKSATS